MGIKTRNAMERAIVVALLESAFAAGLKASIDDSEDGYIIVNNKNVDECMSTIFGLDECMVSFDTEDRDVADDGQCKFWVNLVPGNDGHDIIQDYSLLKNEDDHTAMMLILKPAEDMAERFSAGNLDELLSYADLGRKILLAQGIHELSGIMKDGVFEGYKIDQMDAAGKVTDNPHEAILIGWLNGTLWNDIQIWAHHVQGKDYVSDHGRLTPNGRYFLPDGTEYVDPEFDKVEVSHHSV